MRNFDRAILGCFTVTLIHTANKERPTADTQKKYNKAVTCVAMLIDFHLMCQYRHHNTETIKHLPIYLKSFHEHKNVFLEYRIGKKGKNKVEAAVGKAEAAAGAADEDAEGIRWIADGQRQTTLEKEAHFNFPKMHPLLHYAEQIEEFGQLVQYSTEVSKSIHGAFKDAYMRSNKNNALVQVLNTYIRQHIFDMHEQNIKAWHLDRDLGKQIVQVLAQTHGVGVPLVRDQ